MVIKKNAFTLAEVLITLAIIGIVAAITLISLHNKTNSKELHVAFLKTYSELNQIAQMFYSENDISFSEYCSNQNSTTATTAPMNKLMSYYKGSVSLTSTGQGTKNDDGDYVAYYDMHLLNGKDYSGGKNSGGQNSSFMCDNSGFKSNLTGTLFIMNDLPSSSGTNGPVLCVDINGKKGPNRYGVDYFLFIFTVDGYVIPMGQSHDNNYHPCTSGNGSCSNFSNVGSKYCDNTSSSIAYNTSCAYYALSNTHPTEDGKDYWNDFIGEVYKR